MGDFQHIPVLLPQVMAALRPQNGGLFLDGTLGGAGHARALLEASGPKGRLIGIDQDGEAIAASGRVLGDFGDRVEIFQDNFSNLTGILERSALAGYKSEGVLAGVLLDLGISSYQVDAGAARGFAYNQDGPLDMRMNTNSRLDAAYIVNNYSQEELADLLYRYSEEKWAKRIAQFIIKARQDGPILTTGRLVAIIKAAIPAGAREKDQHPAKRSFQSLRIAVNDELGALKKGLAAAVDALQPGGRICVISFHSLEDRIIKKFYQLEAATCLCPPQSPVCTCGKVARLKIISRKPLIASEREIAANPRARSAKARIAEKVNS